MNPAAPRYWAFISYSHRDARVATALQHALETYRLPRQLIGTLNAAGAVPARLRPVFLDHGDLQAGTDLKAVVREALAQSRYLIVVCSPDAAPCSSWWPASWAWARTSSFGAMRSAARGAWSWSRRRR